MKKVVRKEVQELIDKLSLYYTVEEFKDQAHWDYISCYPRLSEDFIREFKYKVNWYDISAYQRLSEDFIREFEDKVDWYRISIYQCLSEDFIREFKDNIAVESYREINKEQTLEQKLSAIKKYAKKHNLKFDGKYLYAFREHDEYGRGSFNKTISYEKGKYYKDWHCDMREEIENSFGFGIWPNGNTPVKVSVEDWGVAVGRNNSKARVWGFTTI